MPISLTPLQDVAVLRGDMVADSTDPWLQITGIDVAPLAGAFVEIGYSASLWDLPLRPVFRFTLADGSKIDRIAVAPVLGRGFWTGRVPQGTRAIAVSPTNQIGRFDFRIDRIRRRTFVGLLFDGMRRNRRSTRSAILTRLIGWRPESDVNLMWAIGSQPLRDYEAWSKRRTRPREPDGLDRPRTDWHTACPITVFILANDDPADFTRTLDSLNASSFPNWRLGPDKTPDDAGLGVVVPAGTMFKPDALAMVAEIAMRHPEARLIYGDEVRREDGHLRFEARPGWSLRLQATRASIGTAFVRDVAIASDGNRNEWLVSGVLPATFTAGLRAADVVASRRVLVEGKGVADVAAVAPPPPKSDARTSIIIPTRDHPALLRRVIASIQAKSAAGRYEIIIIDNGSVDAETIALLESLRHLPDIRVVPHPGAFNFSLMCNEAAAMATGTVLLFMNDDMEVLSEGWLDRLAAMAIQPDVGAVGAKLTYPDGRIQHVGVLVGMGESAGHFGSLVAGDDVGWAGRNQAVHEVSAVTGACLAVARSKFDAVGGFDAEHLPIELSDIDLCLKLNERGWQTVVDPFVHLMHEESVSRGGATFRRLDVYGGERAVFIDRWRHVLRDDPTFHPGLSLYRWQAALG